MAAVVASKVKRQRQQAKEALQGPSPADSQLIQRKIREARDPSLIAKRREAEREAAEAAYYRQVSQTGNLGTKPEAANTWWDDLGDCVLQVYIYVYEVISVKFAYIVHTIEIF